MKCVIASTRGSMRVVRARMMLIAFRVTYEKGWSAMSSLLHVVHRRALKRAMIGWTLECNAS